MVKTNLVYHKISDHHNANNLFRCNLLIRLMIRHIGLLRIRYYTSVFLSVYLLHRCLNSYSMAPNYSKECLQHKENHRFINDSTDV